MGTCSKCGRWSGKYPMCGACFSRYKHELDINARKRERQAKYEHRKGQFRAFGSGAKRFGRGSYGAGRRFGGFLGGLRKKKTKHPYGGFESAM